MGRLVGGTAAVALIGLVCAAHAPAYDGVRRGSASQVRTADETIVDRSVTPVSVPVEEDHLPAVVETGRHFARIARMVTPSLVHIQSQRPGHGGGTIEETGSGVLMRSEQTSEIFAVTNQHVVAGAKLSDIEIKLYDGRVLHPSGKLEDLDTDVAVLKIQARGLQPATWGDSGALDIGHLVLAMGSPFGLSKSITFGIISAKGRRSLNLGARDVLNQDFLQTDAAINPGNSGGPLIDMTGRVVGINTAIASSSGGNEGIGFSIPSNLVRRVVRQLLTSGRVRRAYLGVRLDDDFTAEKAREYSLDRVRGARVMMVLPQSPAAKAGLQPNDVILSFDGREVEDESHLIHLVSLTEVNRTVRLEIIRSGRRQSIRVKLTDRTQLDSQSALPREGRQVPSRVETRKTGLTVHDMDSRIATQLGLSESTRGLVVMSLPAGRRGASELQLYDCILEVARTPVDSVGQFSELVSRHTDDGPLLMKVRRVEEGQPTDRLVLWHPEARR